MEIWPCTTPPKFAPRCSLPPVGARVCLGVGPSVDRKFLGVVRFAGEVHFTTGQWIGVELDQRRGNSDGSTEGHRYFYCEPNYGAFTPARSILLVSVTDYGEGPARSPRRGEEVRINIGVDAVGQPLVPGRGQVRATTGVEIGSPATRSPRREQVPSNPGVEVVGQRTQPPLADGSAPEGQSLATASSHELACVHASSIDRSSKRRSPTRIKSSSVLSVSSSSHVQKRSEEEISSARAEVSELRARVSAEAKACEAIQAMTASAWQARLDIEGRRRQQQEEIERCRAELEYFREAEKTAQRTCNRLQTQRRSEGEDREKLKTVFSQRALSVLCSLEQVGGDNERIMKALVAELALQEDAVPLPDALKADRLEALGRGDLKQYCALMLFGVEPKETPESAVRERLEHELDDEGACLHSAPAPLASPQRAVHRMQAQRQANCCTAKDTAMLELVDHAPACEALPTERCQEGASEDDRGAHLTQAASTPHADPDKVFSPCPTSDDVGGDGHGMYNGCTTDQSPVEQGLGSVPSSRAFASHVQRQLLEAHEHGSYTFQDVA